MDLEQIIQRLEWLDEERRKDKARISELQNRLANSEGRYNVLEGRIKNVESALSDLKSVSARIAQFHQGLEKMRADILSVLDERDQNGKKQIQELEGNWLNQVDKLSQKLTDLQKQLDVLPGIQTSLQGLDEADQRLRRDLDKREQKIADWLERLEDLRRAISVLEENRRQDLKRMADLQGEIAAVRRRVEEVREKIDLWQDTAKLLDTRINNLLSSEEERRRSQLEFIEAQSRQQVEREREWKEMKARFEAFSEQAGALDSQLAQLQETHRSVERALSTFDSINQRLERRIGEITEMQRLAEDRLRQEWVTFKADDQKRWSAYTLSSEAQYKEAQSQLQKLSERITDLDDEIQTQRALLEQDHDTTEAQLQALMNWAHQWLETFEQMGGRPR